MGDIVAITMPKWGLAMTDGEVALWLKSSEQSFREGEDLVEIETSKMTNVIEAPFSGRIARIIAQQGEKVPVGGLLAVSAPTGAAEADIDAFVADFQSSFVPETEESAGGGGLDIRTIDVGGRGYRVGVTGDPSGATPVVLIHGFSGDLNNWAFTMPALAGVGPCIAIELPGHGSSDKTVVTGSVAELADAALGVLEAMGVSACSMVGHSLGGAVAIAIALRRPELVRGLALVAPAGLPGGSVDSAFLKTIVEAQTARQLKPALAKLFADPERVTREMVEDMLKFKRLDGAEEALAKIAGGLIEGAELRALAARIGDIPTATVIRPTADQIISDAGEALPQGWRVVTVSAGHMPHVEAAGETASLIVSAFSTGG